MKKKHNKNCKFIHYVMKTDKIHAHLRDTAEAAVLIGYKLALMKCEYDPKVCNACNQELRLKACGGCNIAKYCSRYCQVKDWSTQDRQDFLSI